MVKYWRYIFIFTLMFIIVLWLLIAPYYINKEIDIDIIIVILNILNIFYGIRVYEKYKNLITVTILGESWRLVYITILNLILINHLIILPYIKEGFIINKLLIVNILIILSSFFGLRTIEKREGLNEN